MMGSAEQFWQVGPALADRGYHAIAVDLPGHGGSPPAPEADLELFASSIAESVGAGPEVAIGSRSSAPTHGIRRRSRRAPLVRRW